MGRAEEAELLSHLTPEERHSVLSTAAARDKEDLEQFAKYVGGFCKVASWSAKCNGSASY